jgi:hypothetical protein
VRSLAAILLSKSLLLHMDLSSDVSHGEGLGYTIPSLSTRIFPSYHHRTLQEPRTFLFYLPSNTCHTSQLTREVTCTPTRVVVGYIAGSIAFDLDPVRPTISSPPLSPCIQKPLPFSRRILALLLRGALLACACACLSLLTLTSHLSPVAPVTLAYSSPGPSP